MKRSRFNEEQIERAIQSTIKARRRNRFAAR